MITTELNETNLKAIEEESAAVVHPQSVMAKSINLVNKPQQLEAIKPVDDAMLEYGSPQVRDNSSLAAPSVYKNKDIRTLLLCDNGVCVAKYLQNLLADKAVVQEYTQLVKELHSRSIDSRLLQSLKMAFVQRDK